MQQEYSVQIQDEWRMGKWSRMVHNRYRVNNFTERTDIISTDTVTVEI